MEMGGSDFISPSMAFFASWEIKFGNVFFFLTASLSSSDYWLFFLFLTFVSLLFQRLFLREWLNLRCGRGCGHDMKIPRLQSIPRPGSQESGEPFQLHLCSWWLEKSILEYQNRRMPNWQLEWGPVLNLNLDLGLRMKNQRIDVVFVSCAFKVKKKKWKKLFFFFLSWSKNQFNFFFFFLFLLR